jgi:hypothetical protein
MAHFPACKSLTRTLLLAAVGLLPGAMGHAAEATGADLQKLLLDWTALERQQDILKSNWRRQQPILEQQLFLLSREEEELRALLATTADSRDEVESKRLELLQEQTALEQQQQQVQQSLDLAVANVERLYPLLPPPLAEDWQGRMADLRSALLSDSERLQVVVELLTSLHEFQQGITRHETVMELDDGARYLVRQVYLGASQGWYLSADGSRAGYGTSTAAGWHWQSGFDSARVAQLLDVLDGRQPPALLAMPVTLSAP